MSKDKNIARGLSSLLGEELEAEAQAPKIGRPQTSQRIVTKSSQEGTKENETRATFIINEDLLGKLKAVAYWERSLIKDVLAEALQGYLEQYEQKHGKVKNIPKKG